MPALAFCGILVSAATAHAQVEHVDPSIGGVGVLLEPTRPTVHLPHSMVRVYPVRKDALDDQIQSFPLTIISHRLGELFSIMPHSGTPDAAAWDRKSTSDQEKSTPYYYSTRLDESLIRIEFTPTERCGHFRFTFPSGKPVVLLATRKAGDLSLQGDRAVSGVENFNGMRAFVYGEFSAPVTASRSASGENTRLAIAGAESDKLLEFRYGVSFISVEQARANLAKEIGQREFDKTRESARGIWNKALGRIQVEGGTPDQKRVFYTCLYRCFERMVNISEDGRYYSNFDKKVHEDPRPFYVDNWIWDNFRALEPLQTLLSPKQQADKIQSYVRMFEQSGALPSFAVLWGDHACMTGNHAAPWFLDSWLKGVRDFDLKSAYQGLRRNSVDATILPWLNGAKTPLDDFYNEKGYFPTLKTGEKETVEKVHTFERRQGVAVTLGQSYDDWSIAQIARELENPEDFEFFLKRAGNYRHVYRTDKGSVWPKDADGKWIDDFDPKFSGGMGGRDYTTENNAYTYNWCVQHDFDGMIDLMGGVKAAEAKLDQHFREDLGRSKYAFFSTFPDSTAMVGQFSMGNEPSFSTPYIYNHLGTPWKTQKRIRQLIEYAFTDTLTGIPGDEDGGGMSAFTVFSMMGFYPVVTGVPIYQFGSPVFEKITVSLEDGGKLEIVAKGASRDNKYINGVRLNGQQQSALWFRHGDVLKGLKIELEMSDTPNHALGSDKKDLPPSRMDLDPRTLR